MNVLLMPVRSWLLLLPMLLLGCRAGGGADFSGDPATEIAANPRLLADYSVPIESMTLRGVRLGDPPGAIDPNRIHYEGSDGWIITRDHCRYRVVDGRIITLGVWDQALLSQLGVQEEADIERVFGKAEKISKVDTLSTKMTIYRFAGDQRRASWDRILGRLSTVNIGSVALTTQPE